MTYRVQDRLQHANDRFAEVNAEDVIYISGTIERPIKASPILIAADELADGDAAVTRADRQDWAIDLTELGNLYPPEPNHKIRRQTGEEFMISSMGRDEPPYCHVTSRRNRVIVHTVRVRKALI